MAKLESSIIIKSDIETIVGLTDRVTELPYLMPEIEEIKILKSNGNKRISQWKVSSYGITLEWKQEDIINFEENNFRFKMIEGNMRKYEGWWNFEKLNGRTKVTLTLEIEIGIPLIGAFINSMLQKKLKTSLDNLLEIIKKEAEK